MYVFYGELTIKDNQVLQCSVADSCRQTKYLQPGLCLDLGCGKGGDYKICCTYPWNGTRCSHPCSGTNFSGTCGPGCASPGPFVTTCPGGGSICDDIGGTYCVHSGPGPTQPTGCSLGKIPHPHHNTWF